MIMNEKTIITILFAPDGTIIARGLHGKVIKKQLQELFQENKY
jgi:hypothetical protein